MPKRPKPQVRVTNNFTDTFLVLLIALLTACILLLGQAFLAASCAFDTRALLCPECSMHCRTYSAPSWQKTVAVITSYAICRDKCDQADFCYSDG